MKNQSCLVKAILIYFFGGIVLSIVGGMGYFAYSMWAEFYLENPMLFTFCWALAITVLVVSLVVPFILWVFGKKEWAKFVFFSISIPATGIAFMVALDALVIDVYLAMDTELGITLTFPLMVLCIGICAILTSLVVALSFRLLKKRRLSRATMRRVFLPFVCLTVGATLWAFLVDWLIVDLTGLEQIIHFISITGAVFGVTLGGALYFMIKRVMLGFFSGFGAAVVFLDYLVYGCIKLFQVPPEYYGFIALGFAAFYLLLGIIYCLARFKKIKSFISEGTEKYWLTD